MNSTNLGDFAGAADPWSHARRHPDRTAIAFADTGEKITYGELIRRANQFAQWLVREGLKPGDTIAVFLENTPTYFELLWGAKSCGLHYVCLPRTSTSSEVAHILTDSGTKVVVTSPALLQVAAAAVRNLPVSGLVLGDAQSGFQSYADAIKGQPTEAVTGRPRGNSMLYSSGTTGTPKGIRAALLDVPPTEPPARYPAMVASIGIDSTTVYLGVGPLYHVATQRQSMTVLRAGGCVVLASRFDARACLDAIATYRVTHAFFVPTMFVRMLALPQEVRSKADVSSLRYVIHGAAPCSIPVKEAMIAWWGPIIHELYGGTEGNGVTAIDSVQWLAHRGSVGLPWVGTEVGIFDASGEHVPPGMIGTVYMRNGRDFAYHNDSGKTGGARLPGGWSTLGDLGYLDDDGYLYLTGRTSDMIITGGVNVYPKEAEQVLVRHPAVADVAVLGVPDADLGESVHAVVQPTAAASDALRDELLAYCRTSLSRVKCPRSLEFLEELPRNETGKVSKRELLARWKANQA